MDETNSNSNTNNQWEAIACFYLDFGFSVIPVSKDKKPLIAWKEYQTRKPTLEEAKQWMEFEEFGGFAVVTGSISKVFVLDIDQGADISDWDIPKTVSVRTGSGGQHFFFSYPEGILINNRTGLRNKVDIRGEGGCAIIPPAHHPSGKRYEWINDLSTPVAEAPEWLLEELKDDDSTKQVDWNKAEILEGVTESTRNESASKVIGKYLSRFLQHEWESVAWPAVKGWNRLNTPPLSLKELRSVFDSIASREARKRKGASKPVKTNRLVSSYYIDSNIVAEQLFDGESNYFVVFDIKNKTTSRQPYIDISKGTLYPISSSLIDKRNVLLPSKLVSESENMDQEILAFIHKWLDISKFSERLCLYYIKMTWIYDLLTVVPYLRALGDYGTGKTRFVQTVGSLCYRPLFLAGCSSDAYLFRVIELFKGTMVINELERVDTEISAQITNILNNGYERGMGVGRVEGNKVKVPTVYDVFCPKIISARQPYRDLALESRIITCKMYSTTRKDIPITVDDLFHEEATNIRNQLLAYRFGRLSSNACGSAGLAELSGKANVLEDLEPRLRQTLTPLLQVVPEDDMESFLKYANDYQQEMVEERGFQLDGIVAHCLIDLINSISDVSIKELRGCVNEVIDNEKFKITPQKIGRILKSWGYKTEPRGHEKLVYIIPNERIFTRIKSRFVRSEERPASPATPAKVEQNAPNEPQEQEGLESFMTDVGPATPKQSFDGGKNAE